MVIIPLSRRVVSGGTQPMGLVRAEDVTGGLTRPPVFPTLC